MSACCTSRLARDNASGQTHSETSSNYLCTNDGYETGGMTPNRSARSRSCIGDHFAMLEATLGLATIIPNTEIESLDDDFPVAVPLTMVAAAPIRARIHSRN
jgi:hypothetical protein